MVLLFPQRSGWGEGLQTCADHFDDGDLNISGRCNYYNYMGQFFNGILPLRNFGGPPLDHHF